MKHTRTRKTKYYLESGMIKRTLTRSFDTLEAAEKFASGKVVIDIYRFRNRFRVEWIKTIQLEEV